MSTLVMVVLMVAAFWLLLIRPAQKKQKQQQELVNKLGEGSRVMLSSGVFGTIIHNGEKQAIVEVSPGVEMTVLKQAIIRAVEPSEEEFEYDDEADLEVDTLPEVPADAAAVVDADALPEVPADAAGVVDADAPTESAPDFRAPESKN